jgi:hypothetical protein
MYECKPLKINYVDGIKLSPSFAVSTSIFISCFYLILFVPLSNLRFNFVPIFFIIIFFLLFLLFVISTCSYCLLFLFTYLLYVNFQLPFISYFSLFLPLFLSLGMITLFSYEAAKWHVSQIAVFF